MKDKISYGINSVYDFWPMRYKAWVCVPNYTAREYFIFMWRAKHWVKKTVKYLAKNNLSTLLYEGEIELERKKDVDKTRRV